VPTKKPEKSTLSLFDYLDVDDINADSFITTIDLYDQSHKIEKWGDKREHHASTEVILNVVVPSIRETWTTYTPETAIDPESNTVIRAILKGKRLGAKMQIELSIFTKMKQLNLI